MKKNNSRTWSVPCFHHVLGYSEDNATVRCSRFMWVKLVVKGSGSRFLKEVLETHTTLAVLSFKIETLCSWMRPLCTVHPNRPPILYSPSHICQCWKSPFERAEMFSFSSCRWAAAPLTNTLLCHILSFKSAACVASALKAPVAYCCM